MTDIAQQPPLASDAPLMTADGVSLKQKLALTTRRARIRALLLTLPLIIFISVSFVIPIGQMLFRSVYNPAGSNVLPSFTISIQQWDGQGLPSEAMFEDFVKDMQLARKNRITGKTVGNLATRVNYEVPGSRSLFTKSSRKMKKITARTLQGSLD